MNPAGADGLTVMMPAIKTPPGYSRDSAGKMAYASADVGTRYTRMVSPFGQNEGLCGVAI